MASLAAAILARMDRRKAEADVDRWTADMSLE
jgi:hypothetical protein